LHRKLHMPVVTLLPFCRFTVAASPTFQGLQQCEIIRLWGVAYPPCHSTRSEAKGLRSCENKNVSRCIKMLENFSKSAKTWHGLAHVICYNLPSCESTFAHSNIFHLTSAKKWT
jgi:hypothetical protein